MTVSKVKQGREVPTAPAASVSGFESVFLGRVRLSSDILSSAIECVIARLYGFLFEEHLWDDKNVLK